jgi:hypothetical protein
MPAISQLKGPTRVAGEAELRSKDSVKEITMIKVQGISSADQ